MDPKTKSLCDLQSLSIYGCESAARIFQAHSKRPYFKKIDLLCNRLKQDLSNTNKAVININSHGVAWAIKDFIFVFNRIINAWVIMRDYFYSNSEGMQCVRDSIDPNFAQDFLIWQVRFLVESINFLNNWRNGLTIELNLKTKGPSYESKDTRSFRAKKNRNCHF